MKKLAISGAACSGQNRATAQPRNRATAQPRNRATAQPRNRAIVQGVPLPKSSLVPSLPDNPHLGDPLCQ